MPKEARKNELQNITEHPRNSQLGQRPGLISFYYYYLLIFIYINTFIIIDRDVDKRQNITYNKIHIKIHTYNYFSYKILEMEYMLTCMYNNGVIPMTQVHLLLNKQL